MYYPKQKLLCLAVASACATLTVPGYAQEAAQTTDAVKKEAASDSVSPVVQTVVVSGLRNSLASSMALKRNSDGIVDGIVAADIGKFPDTNLAESLQRISGVSIDRSIGEGSKITVRGVGPDFNMVLLNGRQMATSNLGDRNGRAFDFANLASEAISQIQVYKTGRAENPVGGIGATVNVMTARPLERPGLQASVGIKAVHDTSNNRLPGDVKASSSTTPEVSGIFSNTFADGKFGVALSASYQERNLGFNQAAVSNGWKGPYAGGTGPLSQQLPADVTNAPAAGTIYQLPQNLNYSMSGVQRQRTNGQLTLQFAPIKSVVTTLDYTYSENKIQTKRADLSAWFNQGPSRSTWTGGNPSAPLVYTEFLPAGNGDIAMGGADFATKTANNAVGFNAAWRVSNDLKLEFDAHKSTAESTPDSQWGSDNTIGTASFSRGNTTADFTQDFPVLSIEGADFARAPQQVTGSTFQNGYMKGEVAQQQIKGRLKIHETSNLNFGVAATKVNNRSAFSNQQRDSWGGATTPADYPASVFHAETLRQYFGELSGSNNPNLYNQFNTFNFEQVRALVAAASGMPELYRPKTTYDTDQRTQEKSKSAFLQINTDWNTALPMHTAVGVRYETTDVVSTALVPTATGISMGSANEFTVIKGAPNFTTLTGTYKHFLPSIDYDVDLRSDIKLRASYGVTIGRPRFDQIAGGQILDNLARVEGGTGSQGNPSLLPVKSKNLDLSAEWYYNKQSFLSVGFFRKNLENYAGQSQVTSTPFNLHTPVGGALWNEAIASGCITSNTVCIRNYIFRTHPTAPGVTPGPNDANGDATGTILGQPADPIANFRITTFSNQKAANLKGAELNVQHMFGNTGFGVQANYTYVDSNLTYKDASPGEQFALIGLSNSANLVGIYEDSKWTVRAAYNWRDKFLSSVFDGAGPNPNYVEAYGQLDLSVGYAINEKISAQVEVINATDSTARVHGRNERQALYVTQTGPRYMASLRYKF
jgi:TonB-dependent receptor